MDTEKLQEPLLKQFSEDQKRFLLETVNKSVVDAVKAALIDAAPILAAPAVEVVTEMGCTPRVMGHVEEITGRWGGTPEDVFLKALVLYQIGLEAGDEGNHLAIITPDDAIVQDVEGIDPRPALRKARV